LALTSWKCRSKIGGTILNAMARAITPRTKLVFVASPNDPTGTANDPEELTAWARALPEHVVAVFDEAYAEYLALKQRWTCGRSSQRGGR